MSEKRFVYEDEHFPIALRQIRDTQNNETYDLEECCDLLNDQQADLNYLARFIGEFKVEKFKLKLRNLRILEDKVLEQQATINKFREEELYVQDTLRFYYSQIEQKKQKIQILEKKKKQLEEENECLKNFIDLFNMRQKWKLYNFAMKNRDCDNDE